MRRSLLMLALVGCVSNTGRTSHVTSTVIETNRLRQYDTESLAFAIRAIRPRLLEDNPSVMLNGNRVLLATLQTINTMEVRELYYIRAIDTKDNRPILVIVTR